MPEARGFEDVLFLNNRGKSITRVMVYNIVKKAAVLANINKNISPHTLRHSFATHLMNRGADIRAVGDLLGHASLSSTQVYTHVKPEKMREVYKQSHPRGEK